MWHSKIIVIMVRHLCPWCLFHKSVYQKCVATDLLYGIIGSNLLCVTYCDILDCLARQGFADLFVNWDINIATSTMLSTCVKRLI